MEKNYEPEPVLMRVDRFARKIDKSRSSVYELISKGGIAVVRVGNSLRIPATEIDRLQKLAHPISDD